MDKIESDNKFIKIAEKKISNLKKTKIDKIIIHKKSVAPSALSEFKLYEIMPVSLKFSAYLYKIKASSFGIKLALT